MPGVRFCLHSDAVVGNTAPLPANDPGAFYFALLISDTEAGPFTFTGMYGTNSALAGRIFPYATTVTGWHPGATMTYEVAGWSANLGVNWNALWLVSNVPAGPADNVWGAAGYFGLSSMATGTAGGNSPPPAPAWNLFGGTGLTGLNLPPVGVPEPSSIQLWSIGATVLVIFRCRRIIRPNEAHAVGAPPTPPPACTSRPMV